MNHGMTDYLFPRMAGDSDAILREIGDAAAVVIALKV